MIPVTVSFLVSDSPHIDARDLLSRWLDGDERAAEMLVEQLHPLVAKIVAAHLPRREHTADLVQEVFAKVFQRTRQFRGRRPLEHWVSRIAVTTCRDRLRHHARRPALLWSELSEAEQAALDPATTPDPLHLSPDEARSLLDRLLARLKPDQRSLIVWLDLEQRSIAEVARLTATPAPLVRLRAHRARTALRLHAERFAQIHPAP